MKHHIVAFVLFLSKGSISAKFLQSELFNVFSKFLPEQSHWPKFDFFHWNQCLGETLKFWEKKSSGRVRTLTKKSGTGRVAGTCQWWWVQTNKTSCYLLVDGSDKISGSELAAALHFWETLCVLRWGQRSHRLSLRFLIVFLVCLDCHCFQAHFKPCSLHHWNKLDYKGCPSLPIQNDFDPPPPFLLNIR